MMEWTHRLEQKSRSAPRQRAARMLSNHVADSELPLQFDDAVVLLSVVGEHLKGLETADMRLILDGFCVKTPSRQWESTDPARFTQKMMLSVHESRDFCDRLIDGEFRAFTTLLSPLIVADREGVAELRHIAIHRAPDMGNRLTERFWSAAKLPERNIDYRRIINSYWIALVHRGLMSGMWKLTGVRSMSFVDLAQYYDAVIPPEVMDHCTKVLTGEESNAQPEEVDRHNQILKSVIMDQGVRGGDDSRIVDEVGMWLERMQSDYKRMMDES